MRVTDVGVGFRGSVRAADFITAVRDAYARQMPQVAWVSASASAS